MKKERFNILLSALVALAALGFASAEVQNRIPTVYYRQHGFNKTGASDTKFARLTSRSTKYVTKDIGKGASGTIELTDSSMKEQVGITNFRSNKMDIGNILVFDRVYVLVGSYDESHPTPVHKLKYYENSFFPELQNSELSIYTGGELVATIPLSALKEVDTADTGYYELIKPGYLIDGQDFSFKLKMPDVTDGTKKYVVRVILDGIELKA